MSKSRKIIPDPSLATTKQNELINAFGASGFGFSKEAMPNVQRLIPLLFMLQRDHGLVFLEYRLIKLGTPKKDWDAWEALPWLHKKKPWGTKPTLLFPTDTLGKANDHLSRLSDQDRHRFEIDMAMIAEFILEGTWKKEDGNNADEYLEIRIPKNYADGKDLSVFEATPREKVIYVLQPRQLPAPEKAGNANSTLTLGSMQESPVHEDVEQDAEPSEADSESTSDDDSDSEENVVPLAKPAD